MNILITGMIGSGAKDIARKIADTLGRKFVDTDEVMTRNLAITLQEFYSLLTLESQADLILRLSTQLSQSDSYIIAVGDMILTDDEAMRTLKTNAFTVYLKKNIDEIFVDDLENDHPLLARGRNRLYELYEERQALYSEYADATVSFSDTSSEEILPLYYAFSSSYNKLSAELDLIDKDLYELLYKRGTAIYNNEYQACEYAEKYLQLIQGEEK